MSAVLLEPDEAVLLAVDRAALLHRPRVPERAAGEVPVLRDGLSYRAWSPRARTVPSLEAAALLRGVHVAAGPNGTVGRDVQGRTLARPAELVVTDRRIVAIARDQSVVQWSWRAVTAVVHSATEPCTLIREPNLEDLAVLLPLADADRFREVVDRGLEASGASTVAPTTERSSAGVRPKRLIRPVPGASDRVFRGGATVGGLSVLAIMGLVGTFLFVRALAALRATGFSFLTTAVWEPDARQFGIAAVLTATVAIALVAVSISIPLAVGTALFISEAAPRRLRQTFVSMVDLMAAVPSIVQTNGGPGNWAPFDRVVAAVKARDMRLVATLTDEWNGGCDGGAGTEKTIEWYQGGYREPDLGHALGFRDYAAQVAARYAGEPTVALWQLVNEAQANTRTSSGQLTCDNDAGKLALRSFADDMVGVLKGVDPNHLVNLGTLGGSQCGMAGSAAYQYIHSGLVDVCEFHDYGHSAAALPVGPDLLSQRINDCATLPGGAKPLFVGEAGIQGNVQADGGPAPCTPWPSCTGVAVTVASLVQRAQFFEAKIGAAFAAGVDGYVIWVKSPFYSSTADVYAIGDRDPTEGAMAAAAVPQGSGQAQPTITGVKPCNKSAIVTWTPAPGALVPQRYEVTAFNGPTASVAGSATAATVTGLANGQSYTFTVSAIAADGSASQSAPSAAVVPHRSAKCGTPLKRLRARLFG